MVHKHMRGADGKYTINGRKYELLEGSRAQVWHETAYKTAGGLIRLDLLQNKHGRIVSRKKSISEKKLGRLAKHGWTAKKGKFGAVRIGSGKGGKTRKRQKTKRRATVGGRRK
jgi:hypothetical protein